MSLSISRKKAIYCRLSLDYFLGVSMNNTNVGSGMAALLPKASPATDRIYDAKQPEKPAHSEFKDNMKAIEEKQVAEVPTKKEAPTKKEDSNNEKEINQNKSDDIESKSNDHVANQPSDADDNENNISQDGANQEANITVTEVNIVTEENNSNDVETILGLSATLQPVEIPSLSVDIESVALDPDDAMVDITTIMNQQAAIVLSSQDVSLTAMPEQPLITEPPLITELSQLTSIVTNQSALNKNSPTNNPLTGLQNNSAVANPLSETGLLPASGLLNKVSPEGLAAATADLTEAALFDIASALAKEQDKSVPQPVMNTVVPTSKIAAETLVPGQLSLNTSFQAAGQWGQAVTEKVMWMSSKGIKEAVIQLDPPELGSLQIKVSVHQDQAHVSFTVQHASVREALDQQSMRLREMFAEDGLHLADVDVSDQSQSKEERDSEREHSLGQATANDEVDNVSVTPLQSQNRPYSLVDAYI